MSTPVIVTGDDVTLKSTLLRDGEVFEISDTAEVKAMLIADDGKKLLTSVIDQDKDTPGADWSNSLIMVVIPSTETEAIINYGTATLEIQVNDGGKNTWHDTVNIVKGHIG